MTPRLIAALAAALALAGVGRFVPPDDTGSGTLVAVCHSERECGGRHMPAPTPVPANHR